MNSEFRVHIIGKRYDNSDPTDPVKYEYSHSNLIIVIDNSESISDITLTENKFSIDNWYSLFYKEDEKSFYSVKEEKPSYLFHFSSKNC